MGKDLMIVTTWMGHVTKEVDFVRLIEKAQAVGLVPTLGEEVEGDLSIGVGGWVGGVSGWRERRRLE
jgi:hypothetical protein